LLDELLHIERTLREWATRLQMGEKVDWREVRDLELLLHPVLDTTWPVEDHVPEVEKASHALQTSFDVFGELEEGLKRGEVTDQMVHTLREFEEDVREFTGRRCTFFDWDGERRGLAAFINDFAACLHSMALTLMEKYGLRKGVCAYISRDAEPWTRELCIEIEEIAERTHAEGDALAIAVDGELEVRTGNPSGVGEGHVVDMYIRKKDNTLEFEWTPKYDEHYEVAERLVEEKKCKPKEYGLGFKCEMSIEELKKLLEEIWERFPGD